MRYLLIVILSIFLLGCSSDDTEGIYDLDTEVSSILSAIEDSDVIVLAEPTHLSSDIDEKFLKLINGLVNESDYNIVGLETSNAELNYYLNYYDKDNLQVVRNESVMEKYRHQNFSILYQKHWDNELSLVGIDWMPTIYPRSTNNTHLLENIYQDIKMSNSGDAEEFKSTEIKLRDFTNRMIQSDEQIDFNEIDSYLKFYNKLKSSRSYKDWNEHTKDFIKNRINTLSGPLSKNYLGDLEITNPNQDYFSRRGQGMFERIQDLVQEGNKVIVWVHNWHAIKKPENIDILSEEWKMIRPTDHYSLGYLLRESNLKTYIIGTYFNSAENFSSIYYDNENLERITDEKFLESQLSNYGKNTLFINLEENNKFNKKFKAYDEGFIEYELNPKEQFDGIIYLDHLIK